MDNWVKILSTGGVGGVLVFAVAFLLKWQSRYMKDAPPAWRQSVILVFLGTWLLIFVAAGLTMYVGVRREISDQAVIHGRLVGLKPTMDFESPFDALYLRRVAKTQSQAAFVWLIVSQQKLSGEKVDLLLDGSTPEHEDVDNCEMPIKPDFYGREVVLKYDSRRRLLMEDGIPLNCSAAPLLAGIHEKNPVAQGFRFHLVPRAYAQGPDQKAGAELEAMSERLESNDAVVRLQARADLAAAGRDGIPYIQKVMSNPKSSYRLRLGALVALNNIKVDDSGLVPQANCAIVRAAGSDDETLREQARKYVARHSNLPLPLGCKQNSIPAKVPMLPRQLKNAKAVYIANFDSFDTSSSPEKREALAVLEESIRKWGGLRVVSDSRLADVVLSVESHGSEDTLTLYDARLWPTQSSAWQMSLKNGMQGKNAPLVGYLEKAFENTPGH